MIMYVFFEEVSVADAVVDATVETVGLLVVTDCTVVGVTFVVVAVAADAAAALSALAIHVIC